MSLSAVIREPVEPAREKFVTNQPIIVAEAGVNHEGQMDLARRLIDEAAEGGADAIKFQTYKAGSIASKHSPAYWDTTKETTLSQYELFKKYDKFGKKEFEELKKCCDASGIEFLSTPFDQESADFLDPLMSVFKISSSDITNRPFIDYLCSFNKPIILSTGASNVDEIDDALSWIDGHAVPVALLHCILNYPTEDKDANLRMIVGLKNRYPNRTVGYSDHTLPSDMKTMELAYVLGAKILEKHFTYDKTLAGNDHYHAMDKFDLETYRDNMNRVVSLLGEQEKRYLQSEEPARRHARRSLVATHLIKKGAVITQKDVTWKRPAHGISPAHIGEVIGLTAIQDIEGDEIMQWRMLR